MKLEWLVVAGVVLAVLTPLVLRVRSASFLTTLLLLLAGTVVGGKLWQRHLETKEASRQELLTKTPRQGRPGGYVGAETCRACHPEQYGSWHRSYHRTMTQYASPAAVRGRFDDVPLRLGNETFHLQREGDEFYVDMVDPDWKQARALQQRAADRDPNSPPPPSEPNPPRSRKRVGLLTGSHHMQAYWVASKVGNEQFSFPFTYLFEEERWVPRNDVFLLPPESPALQQVWNGNCMICHATAGQPRKDPQTHITDTQVAEIGISCEACHGPAENHVRAYTNPVKRYAQHQRPKPETTIVNPARQSSKKASENCSQCHAIRYNDRTDWRYDGFNYRPGDDLETHRPVPRFTNLALRAQLPPERREDPTLWKGSYWNDGMVRVSGREYNGLIESPCYLRGELSCLSCHSMHQSKPDDQLAAGMESNQACLQCHGEIGHNLTAHTHHRAESSGSSCYNCHMPHTTYGLLKAIRSHQVSSPHAAASLTTGRPTGCNLCHLDRSLGWTAQYLSEWYQHAPPSLPAEEKTISSAALGMLRGNAGLRALIAWHMGWEPAKAASGHEWMAPYLAEGLTDPYSAVRYIAQRSLKRLPGFEHLDYDYISAPDQRAAAREQSDLLWRNQPPSSRTTDRTSVLQADGRLDARKFLELLRQRDLSPLVLLE